MWQILAKYGVPDVVICLIRSLHDNMLAAISLGGIQLALWFPTAWGGGVLLCLSCFFYVVIWCWHQWCAQLGVRYLYKCGGKLVGKRTRAPSTSWMTELSFANDAAVVASTREDLVKGIFELNSVVTACGLTISIPKTKFWLWGVTWCRVTWTHCCW